MDEPERGDVKLGKCHRISADDKDVYIELAPLLVMLAIAAVIDARYRRIPNWLTFGLLAAGLGRAIVLGSTSWGAAASSLGHALLGMLVGAALPLVLYAISALGGGDVKLLAAVGAWLGPKPIVIIFLVEAVVGLVIVLIQAFAQGRVKVLFRNSALIAANMVSASEVGLEHTVETGKSLRSVNRPLPYAVPVLIATLLVVWAGTVVWR